MITRLYIYSKFGKILTKTQSFDTLLSWHKTKGLARVRITLILLAIVFNSSTFFRLFPLHAYT